MQSLDSSKFSLNFSSHTCHIFGTRFVLTIPASVRHRVTYDSVVASWNNADVILHLLLFESVINVGVVTAHWTGVEKEQLRIKTHESPLDIDKRCFKIRIFWSLAFWVRYWDSSYIRQLFGSTSTWYWSHTLSVIPISTVKVPHGNI